MKSKATIINSVFLRTDFWLHVLLAIAVNLPAGQIAYAQQQEQQQQQYSQQNTEYFKLVSTVEYIAKQGSESRQYRHQLEPWFVVTSRQISDTQKNYHLATGHLKPKYGYIYDEYKDIAEINYDLTEQRYMTSVDNDLLHLMKMNNECIDTLDGKAVNEVGKTWTCRYDLRTFNHYSLPDELKFTVTSIKVPTKELGDLLAVRAISDPFLVKAMGQVEEYGYVKCRVASVYLFDPYLIDLDTEDVYVSAQVFLAATKMDNMDQEYRYEFGTYKTDANGVPVDLNGLDYVFEDFVRKIRLIPEPIDANTTTGMPFWAKSEIVNAAQIATACAAVTCEQSMVNPVASIYLAAARTYEFQGEICVIPPAICERSVCQALRADVDAIHPMEICGERPFPFFWLGAIPIALATYHHSHDDKSPSSP